MRSVEVEHYPFALDEDECTIDTAVSNRMGKLFSYPIFSASLQEDLPKHVFLHYLRARFMFLDEEELRSKGFCNANLYYHGKEHAVFQTTYDAITTTEAILSRDDKFSGHLTREGIVAIVIAAMYHDTGFVYQKNPLVSFARMSPIHVEESKRAAIESLEVLKISDELDMEKIKKLVAIGIHGTHFPYDEQKKAEGKQLIDELPLESRREAQIVRLTVQFADLGGQTARIGQNPEGLRRLKEEMNTCVPDLGTKIIGKDDHEIEEKRMQFLKFVVEKTAGRTGNAFFGTRDHSYAIEWHKTLVASR